MYIYNVIVHFEKNKQAKGSFNNGEIIENKPIGFPQDGGPLKPYSNLFYWAHAKALTDSVIGLHPHRGFEIMSIVLKGSIRHYDTLLEGWITLDEGDVQLIQSGSGISHAEAMQKDAEIFQIWFHPDFRKSLQQSARYQDIKSDQFPIIRGAKIIVGKNSHLKLESPGIEIKIIDFDLGQNHIKCEKDYYYSIYLLEGKININQLVIQKDDFIQAENQSTVNYEALVKGKMLYIKSPVLVPYPTY